MDNKTAKDNNLQTDSFQSGPNIKDMLEAFTGFEIKTLRTIRDLLIAPTKIGLQSLNGDKEKYLGQVRLFVLLIGLQSLLFSFTQFFDNINAQTLLANREGLITAYSNHLAQSGYTLENVNKVLQEWVNLLFAPLNALMAFIIGGWFKLIDRRYTYFGHVLLFIVITNSVTLLSMPLIALTNFGASGLGLYTLVSSAILAFITSIFVWRFYKKSVWNGVWKIFLTLIVGIITTAIIGMLMQIILNIVATQTFGIGPMSFLFQNIDLIISETK